MYDNIGAPVFGAPELLSDYSPFHLCLGTVEEIHSDGIVFVDFVGGTHLTYSPLAIVKHVFWQMVMPTAPPGFEGAAALYSANQPHLSNTRNSPKRLKLIFGE